MKEKLRAFIVDDERLQRKELKGMLLGHGGIEVCGEASTMAEAVEKMGKADPDVIFLDIQMPGGSGFDFLERIETDAAVIFVTAFDEYAIRAFEVNALDYLLKPVEPERLAVSIGRLTAAAERPAGKGRLEPSDSIYIKTGSRATFLRVAEISHIVAAGDYTEVETTDGRRLLVSKSLGEWESRLPGERFQRIHRSAMVNIREIDRVIDRPGTTCEVYMKGSAAPLMMSRRRRGEIKKKLR